MAAPADRLLLDAPTARRLVLARAIDEADAQGRLIGAAEREQADREALVSVLGHAPAPDEAPDPGRYLDERARRLLKVVEQRDALVAAQQHGTSWQRWVGVALPLLALAAGALLERIDNPRQVNMLSPPLLAFIAWNLALYVALVASLFVRPLWSTGGRRGPGWLRGLGETLTRGIGGRRRARAAVLGRFHQLWWRIAGSAESLRIQRLLHVSAAAWAVGVAISIVLGGLVREYRVGWESTLLDLHQVHALLRGLFAPVVAVLPIEGFTLADVERMHFRSGIEVAPAQARHWIALYLGLLAVVVLVPRLLLAAFAALRARWLERALPIDLADPYYAQLLANVSPVRVTIAWRAEDEAARTVLRRMWAQAGATDAGAAAQAQPVLRTERGDELLAAELTETTPLLSAPPGQAPPPPAQGAVARISSWLWPLPAQAALAQVPRFDIAVFASTQGAARPSPEATALPCLLLQHEPVDAHPHPDAVELASASCWAWEAPLHAAIERLVPAHKRPGMQRLVAAWNERHAQRLQAAMRTIAEALLYAAREAEPVAAASWSFKRIVNAEERDVAQQAREQATRALLERLGQSQARCIEHLHSLHGRDPAAIAAPHQRTADIRLRGGVDAPQAGMAGAASGAAAGATIDLMVGGLTLGAAAALGAVLGGGAAMVAAAWRNRSTPSGQAQVQMSDEMLQALAEGLLLQYLRVALRDNDSRPDAPPWPPGAQAEVVALVEAKASAFAATWEQARRTPASETKLPGNMAGQLEGIARELLARIRPR